MNNQVTDLSPLGEHPSLSSINAGNNQIASLAGLTLPMSDGSSCYELDLGGNPIGADQLTEACSWGWFILWGGAYGIDVGSCGPQLPCLAGV